jgi:phospholipid/cholesterol/gamma-HCH transport system substrate-binding protein
MPSVLGRSVLVAGLALALTGCGTYPPNLIPLPGREGAGGGAYQLTIEMADVANVVPNQDVRVADVPVGHVRSIDFDNWHAKVVVGINADTKLPANTTARIAQKSLLGAEYLELVPPPGADPAAGQLRDGDVIPLARTGRYPETEEVLAVLSTVLNGGGLNQIRTITTELNAAFSGKEPQVRELLESLKGFVGALDARRTDIVRAIEGIDKLGVRLNTDRDKLAHAIDTLPGGVKVLNDQRQQLVHTLDALGELGDKATGVIDSSHQDLVANLHHLQPALNKLADSGKNLTESLSEVVSYPFPSNTSFPAVLKGDYGNLYATLDLDPVNLLINFGSPAAPVLSLPLIGVGLPPVGPTQGAPNPLEAPFVKAPVRPELPEVKSLLPGAGSKPDRPDHPAPSPGQLLGPIIGGR